MDTQRLTAQTAEDLSILDRAFPLGLAQQPELRPGERRPVAVLFFSLRGIGSLETVSSIEQPVQLRNGILRLLGRLVEAYGGYVDKYSGGRIMALFGARLAGENDSVRAAETALRMMETIDEVCGSFGIPAETLSPVAGITFGEVTVAPDPSGHLTATGTPVNLAARLESMAEAGQILAGSALRQQCRDAVSWEDLGLREVKGLSEPEGVFRLEGLTGHGTGWNPVRVSRRELPFVGRRKELQTLRSGIGPHLEDPHAPNLLVLIEGEAGLGKSRLAREALRQSGVEDYAVGHTRPYAQPPFWLWTTLLQHLLGDRSPGMPDYDSLGSFLGELSEGGAPFTEREAEALAYLLSLPEAEAVERLGDRLRRERIRFAVARLVRALAARGRNVLMLDDLQWADAASLEMLAIIMAQRSDGPPVVAVATAREAPSGVSDMQGPEILGLRLAPLPSQHCLRLAGEVISVGTGAESESATLLDPLIQRYCGGNPLFVEELAAAMSETGLLAARDGQLQVRGDLAAIKVPSTLSALVRARLDRLPRHLRLAAQVAAVIGDDLDRSLAASVLERLGEHETAAGSLDSLIEMGMLVPTPARGLAFRHGMVRTAAYESILRSNRRLLHRLVAEEAEAHLAGPRPEVAAAHWYAAGEVERAMPQQIEALNRVNLASDYRTQQEMVRVTYEWLDELPEGPERTAFMVKVMQRELSILEFQGGSEKAEELAYTMLDTARDSGDPELQAIALSALGHYLNSYKNKDLDKAEEYLEESLALARQMGNDKIRADAMSGLANIYSDIGDAERAYRYHLEVAGLRESLGDLQKAGASYTNLAITLDSMGRLDEAIETLKRSMEIHSRTGDFRGLGFSSNALAISHARQGRLDLAEKMFLQALENHRKVGNRPEVGAVLGNLGTLYKSRGDLERSMDYRSRALKICRETNNRRSEAILLENMGNTAREMGDLDRAGEYLDQALALCEELKIEGQRATTLSMKGLLALDRGDPELARTLYGRARRIVCETGMAREVFGDFCQLRRRLLEAGTPESEVQLPPGWEEQAN